MNLSQHPVDYSTLRWVKGEIDETLNRARQTLESYVGNPDDTTQMRFCATYLHEVYGTLQMVEIQGAALLAEEMEKLAAALLLGEVENRREAFDALMRAMLQLPDYLDRLQAGHRDLPIALLPILNELRVAGGDAALSDSELFFPDLSVEPPKRETALPVSDIRSLARRLRPTFEAALVGLFRNRGDGANIEKLDHTVQQLFDAATVPACSRLWWVAGGLIEALTFEGPDFATSALPLLGLLDRQIKRIVEEGEQALAHTPPDGLVKRLLYHVARARTGGTQVRALQQAFELGTILPSDHELAAAREALSGTNLAVMETVSGVLREDLTQVMDALDIFVRRADRSAQDLQPLLDQLRQISDTLGVLGQERTRQQVMEQLTVLTEMKDGRKPADDVSLMTVADALLKVGSALNAMALREAMGESITEEAEAGADRRTSLAATAVEDRLLLQAVTREARRDIERVKDAIVAFFNNPADKSPLAEATQWLKEVSGGLTILGMDRSQEFVGHCARYIDRALLNATEPPPREDIDRFAEVIAAVQFYLEGVEEERGELDAILDIAQRGLCALGEEVAIDVQVMATGGAPAEQSGPDAGEGTASAEVTGGLDTALEEPMEITIESVEPSLPTPVPGEEMAGAAQALISSSEGRQDWQLIEDAPSETRTPSAPSEGTSLAPDAPLAEQQEAERSPDVECESPTEGAAGQADYVDEAPALDADESGRRELEVALLPAPKTEPQIGPVEVTTESPEVQPPAPEEAMDEALTAQEIHPAPQMRREPEPEAAAGPSLPAEEQAADAQGPLTAQPTESVSTPDSDASVAVAQREPTPEPQETASESSAQSSHQVTEEKIPAPPPPVAPAPFTIPQRALAQEIDAELMEVFIEEATEEIAGLEVNLPRWMENPQETETLRAIRRSFHTLKGSGRMVGANLLGELAWAIENLLNRVIDGTVPVSPDALGIPQEALPALHQLLAQITAGPEPTLDLEELMTRAWALSRGEQPPAPRETAVFDRDEEATEQPGELLAPAEELVTVGASHLDPVLLEIFAQEAGSHLTTLQEWIDDCAPEHHQGCQVSDALIRALHTLHGSAHMADIGPVASVGGALEQFAKGFAASHRPLDSDAAGLLNEGVDAIRAIVSGLASDTPTLPDVSALVARICERMTNIGEAPQAGRGDEQTGQAPGETHTGGAEATRSFLETGGELLHSGEIALTQWLRGTTEPEPIRALHDTLGSLGEQARVMGFAPISELCTAVAGITDLFLESTESPSEAVSLLLSEAVDLLWLMLERARDHAALPPATHLAAKCADLLATQAAQPPSPAQPLESVHETEIEPPAPHSEQQPSSVPHAAEEAPGEPENELLPLFLEEAEEILNNTDSIVHRLAANPNDGALVGQLRRALHTLKGGARMAGVGAVGELSHHLESMVNGVVDGHLPASEAMFELLQDAQDRLSDMVDRVRGGGAVSPAIDLIAQIESLVAPEEEKREVESTTQDASAQPAAEAPEVAEVEATPERRSAPRVQGEQVRVSADLLNSLVNFAGEVSITRSRIDQQIAGFGYNLQEMQQTVARLRDQLRKLEIETETQILFRYEQAGITTQEDFDPLELDRYSQLQQLSRSLMESVSDLVSIHDLLNNQAREAETLLLQQSRITTELQEGLMRTRMVPFAGLAPRLRRVVRQTAAELGKRAELKLEGAESGLDRSVLDRMVAPLEHMLRNSVSHGIESPSERLAAGKPAVGTITVSLHREGQDVVIKVKDDGRGLNIPAIRRKAVERGLLSKGSRLSDSEVMQFILESGFSTASAVTQISGRGVGMDVVKNEVKLIGGSLYIESQEGRGTTFTVHLPLTLAVNQALLVEVEGELFAIPLSAIEAVVQLREDEVHRLHGEQKPSLERAGETYQFVYAGTLLDAGPPRQLPPGEKLPVLLFHTGDLRVALGVDGLLGAREIVVKSVGPQIGRVREISGATILGDGRVVLILDISAIIRKGVALHGALAPETPRSGSDDEEPAVTVMVVDDSITVRRVTARLLERHHMRVITARDGVEAVALLQDQVPDIMLMDIEMPRMDGYELTNMVRSDERLKHIPIIMITSRTGAKHRDHALELGVDHYLGKPYQETELMDAIRLLVPQTQ